MCLYASAAETKKFRKEKGRKTVDVYKIVELKTSVGGVVSVRSPIRMTRIKAGEFASTVTKVKIPANGRFLIQKGIHGFSTKQAALRNWMFCYDEKLIKCKAKASDLIGKAGGYLAFRKITIPQEELDRVKKEWKETNG